MKKWSRGNEPMAAKMDTLLSGLYREFGWKTRLFAPLAGMYLYHNLKKEEVRLQNGWSYEPQAFYEKNAAALALSHQQKKRKVHQVHGSVGDRKSRACFWWDSGRRFGVKMRGFF